MDKRAIQATFVDWKTVKTRKALQLVLEVPLEATQEVLQKLGTPMPDTDIWVAVALMGAEAGKLKGGSLAQQAGIICNEGGFRQFIGVQTADEAAEYIRKQCGVETRAHLDHNDEAAKAFREIKGEYEMWLKVPA